MSARLHLFSVFFVILLVMLAGIVQGRELDFASLRDSEKTYDVMVVGGDPEGIAAAVGAARAGAGVLLVDTRRVLGGLLTNGWLNTIDLNLDRHGKPLNAGVFAEIYRQLPDHSFDVKDMETLLTRLIDGEKNLDYLGGALTVLPVIGSVTTPLYQPGQTLQPDDRVLPASLTTLIQPAWLSATTTATLTGLEIFSQNGDSVRVSGRRFIDATQDADLAVAAGAPWFACGTDLRGRPANMAITLVFKMQGIDTPAWQSMGAALLARKEPNGLLGGTRQSIWGFGDLMQKYQPQHERAAIRGLNLGRQNDGTVLVNALQIFGCDGLSFAERGQARQIAEVELPNIIDFLRQNLHEMANARLAGTAPELYVRTARQIVAQYQLTLDDVLENRDFDDRVAFGSYPLDVQAQGQGHSGDVIGKPEQYAVPLRSLVPIGLTNLLVVGRSAGFDSAAQSSARTVPVGMACGQSAGVLAWLSLRKDMPVFALASDPVLIDELHRLLSAQGVKIGPNPAVSPPETAHWAYPGLKFMRRAGHISGGYTNSYDLDKPISGRAFVNRLVNLRTDLEKPDRLQLYELAGSNPVISLGIACQLLTLADHFGANAVPLNNLPPVSAASAYNRLQSAGLFAPPWPATGVNLQKPLQRGAAYMLLSRWLKR